MDTEVALPVSPPPVVSTTGSTSSETFVLEKNVNIDKQTKDESMEIDDDVTPLVKSSKPPAGLPEDGSSVPEDVNSQSEHVSNHVEPTKNCVESGGTIPIKPVEIKESMQIVDAAKPAPDEVDEDSVTDSLLMLANASESSKSLDVSTGSADPSGEPSSSVADAPKQIEFADSSDVTQSLLMLANASDTSENISEPKETMEVDTADETPVVTSTTTDPDITSDGTPKRRSSTSMPDMGMETDISPGDPELKMNEPKLDDSKDKSAANHDELLEEIVAENKDKAKDEQINEETKVNDVDMKREDIDDRNIDIEEKGHNSEEITKENKSDEKVKSYEQCKTNDDETDENKSVILEESLNKTEKKDDKKVEEFKAVDNEKDGKMEKDGKRIAKMEEIDKIESIEDVQKYINDTKNEEKDIEHELSNKVKKEDEKKEKDTEKDKELREVENKHIDHELLNEVNKEDEKIEKNAEKDTEMKEKEVEKKNKVKETLVDDKNELRENKKEDTVEKAKTKMEVREKVLDKKVIEEKNNENKDGDKKKDIEKNKIEDKNNTTNERRNEQKDKEKNKVIEREKNDGKYYKNVENKEDNDKNKEKVAEKREAREKKNKIEKKQYDDKKRETQIEKNETKDKKNIMKRDETAEKNKNEDNEKKKEVEHTDTKEKKSVGDKNVKEEQDKKKESDKVVDKKKDDNEKKEKDKKKISNIKDTNEIVIIRKQNKNESKEKEDKLIDKKHEKTEKTTVESEKKQINEKIDECEKKTQEKDKETRDPVASILKDKKEQKIKETINNDEDDDDLPLATRSPVVKESKKVNKDKTKEKERTAVKTEIKELNLTDENNKESHTIKDHDKSKNIINVVKEVIEDPREAITDKLENDKETDNKLTNKVDNKSTVLKEDVKKVVESSKRTPRPSRRDPVLVDPPQAAKTLIPSMFFLASHVEFKGFSPEYYDGTIFMYQGYFQYLKQEIKIQCKDLPPYTTDFYSNYKPISTEVVTPQSVQVTPAKVVKKKDSTPSSSVGKVTSASNNGKKKESPPPSAASKSISLVNVKKETRPASSMGKTSTVLSNKKELTPAIITSKTPTLASNKKESTPVSGNKLTVTSKPTLASARKDIIPVKKESPVAKKEPSEVRYKLPLQKYGWKREVVYRSSSDADVYYYSPRGKKLRSIEEIMDVIPDDCELKPYHFSFVKDKLGFDAPLEITKDAYVRPLLGCDGNSPKRLKTNVNRKPFFDKSSTSVLSPKLRSEPSRLSMNGKSNLTGLRPKRKFDEMDEDDESLTLTDDSDESDTPNTRSMKTNNTSKTPNRSKLLKAMPASVKAKVNPPEITTPSPDVKKNAPDVDNIEKSSNSRPDRNSVDVKKETNNSTPNQSENKEPNSILGQKHKLEPSNMPVSKKRKLETVSSTNDAEVEKPEEPAAKKAADFAVKKKVPESSVAKKVVDTPVAKKAADTKKSLEASVEQVLEAPVAKISPATPVVVKKVPEVSTTRARRVVYSNKNLVNEVSNQFNALVHLCKYLRVEDLLRVARVNRLFNAAAHSHVLWQTVKLKNSKVRDWQGLADCLIRHNTHTLDMLKMIGSIDPDENDEIWNKFYKVIGRIHSLRRLELGRVSAAEILNAASNCSKNLTEFSVIAQKMATIDLKLFQGLPNLEILQLRSFESKKEHGLIMMNIPMLTNMKHLRHLSLTGVKNLKSYQVNVLKEFPPLESLELGDCTKLDERFPECSLQHLTSLVRLRLELVHGNIANKFIETIGTLPKLKTLELINIDTKKGFDDLFGRLKTVENILIFPTYITQSSTTNWLVLSGLCQLKDSLKFLTWGLTQELLKVTNMFIEQWNSQRNLEDSIAKLNPEELKKSIVESNSIPIAKPLPEFYERITRQDKTQYPNATKQNNTELDILPIDKLKQMLERGLCDTNIKLITVPVSSTTRIYLPNY